MKGVLLIEANGEGGLLTKCEMQLNNIGRILILESVRKALNFTPEGFAEAAKLISLLEGWDILNEDDT